jgi:SagB-type dehydrogenase family enzyme
VKIQLSFAVRIRPPSELTQNKWIVEDYLRRTRFALPPLTVFILVFCIEPQDDQDVIQKVSAELSEPRKKLERILSRLLEKKLLATTNFVEDDWFKEVSLKWTRKNWLASTDYHLATYNYPFMNMDKEGLEMHSNRMVDYSQVSPDTNRYKISKNILNKIQLPKISASLLTVPINKVFEQKLEWQKLSKDSLASILSITFGVKSQISVPWDGSPLLRKTSPSGGGRHPSEGYVVVIDVPKMESGWYHIRAIGPKLEMICNDEVTHQELMNLFPATYGRARFKVKAIIFFTSVFERNMYRYREPRTFRTIHLDVGHLASTAKLAADALGIKAYPQYTANEKSIEKILKLSGLEEGFMMSIALGE